MKKLLNDYIKIYNNHFSDELCDKTLTELNSLNWHQHTFYNPKTDSTRAVSGSKELDVSHGLVSTKPELMDRVWEGINQYIIKDFAFPWFNTWCGFTDIRFNRYEENRLMANHCDHINSMFDGTRKGIPTLTCLGLLNDDFEGGEFIMFEDELIQLSKGDLMIFPSNFLFPHRVQPVKKGVRNSFVAWVW